MKALLTALFSQHFGVTRHHFCISKPDKLSNFDRIMKNNREWAESCVKRQPDFFSKLVSVQSPKYLWIGCSDSRVPANQILGLKPGQIFVHRNIANIVPPSDVNALAVIQYAVQHLRVQDIIVTGHYGCGGVKASFLQHDFGPLESWLCHLRQLRSKFKNDLIWSEEKNFDRLVELNVTHQVLNVGRLSVVQNAWRNGRDLTVHGLVYNLNDGILKDLGIKMWSLDHIPVEYQIA